MERMNNLMTKVYTRAYVALHNEKGQGMTEYALLLAGIVAVVLIVVGVLTGKIGNVINGLNFG